MWRRSGKEERKPRASRILLAGIIGLLLFLLLLELGMRLAGGFVLWRQASRNATGLQDSGIRIVAIGESTTADFPVPGLLAWPRLLEGRLRAKEVRATVFNEGLIGANSSLLLMRMEQVLAKDRPQIVIAMMGANDGGKLGFSRAGLVSGSFSGFFSSLRVLKLARLFLHWDVVHQGEELPLPSVAGLGSPPPLPPHLDEAIELAKRNEITRARQLLEKELAGSSPLARALAYRAVADSITPPVNVETAREKLMPAYELHRESVRSYLLQEEAETYVLLTLFLQQVDDCRELARSFIEKNLRPNMVTIARLSSCGNSELPEAKALREKYTQGLIRLDKRDIGVIRANYRELYDMLKARGICLIAMQYPLWPMAKMKAYFSAEEIEAGAVSGHLTFASNEENFRAALKVRRYEDLFTDRFALDFGHATQAGNELIADSATRAVEALVRSGKCLAVAH